MKYRESIILLPCHSLEDFPTHHEGDDAQGLLANWSALWHPALIASSESVPAWHRVDDPPEELTDRLILAPSVSLDELPTGFAQRAKGEGANFIRKKADREEIISLALEQLDGGDAGIDQEIVADFLALGYCYLQVELLTRQMRYSSNLDEVHFNNQTVAAATAAKEGNLEEAREKLSACFDVLAEERDHYYPVDAFLIDLTLVAESTVGQALRDELARNVPINLLLSGASLKEMSEQEPESLSALKAKLEDGNASLLGGEVTEHRLPLLANESILAELRRGNATYESLLGKSPTVFARRRFGLCSSLPQVLQKTGFQGALHATLDDGRFPEGMQIKTRWEGPDGSAVDALARVPLDATKPDTYLNLAVKMGESMDMDHVATVCLAHWPGQSSPWLDDLRRIASYSSALGKFVTIEEYFRETDDPGQPDRFTADQYRSPYLKQAIIRRHPDPISTSVRYWRRRAAVEAAESLDALSSFVTGDATDGKNALLARIDQDAEAAENESIDKDVEQAVADATKRFADNIPRMSDNEKLGYLVANPCSYVRRIAVDVSELDALPTIEKPVYAATEANNKKNAVVDVPPMGFAWLTSGKPTKSRQKQIQPLAEDRSEKDGIYLLRNEFFEVVIDGVTGALRSLYEYKHRGNRLSQQLAYRLPGKQANVGDQWSDPDESAIYSVMAADEVRITSDSTVLGEIVTRGRLLDREGTELAGFKQTYRLWRGSRVLLVDIHLDPKSEPRADPWNSYFSVRFAWAEETADLWRALNGSKQPVGSKRFEAPQYVGIENADGKRNITILTGGLPFHRRIGMRMLDSLLIVRGETARDFQIGIGIDVNLPMQAAMNLTAPETIVSNRSASPSPADSSWLFHIDARNIVATHWSPLVEEGTIKGFRARLQETSGRSSRVAISSFRNIAAARQVDFQGNSIGDCKVDEGRVRIDFSAHEWVEVECRW